MLLLRSSHELIDGGHLVYQVGQLALLSATFAEEEDELNLEVGDIITNIADVEDGWCEGILNGKKGMFPINFAEEVVAPEPSSNVNTGEKL